MRSSKVSSYPRRRRCTAGRPRPEGYQTPLRLSPPPLTVVSTIPPRTRTTQKKVTRSSGSRRRRRSDLRCRLIRRSKTRSGSLVRRVRRRLLRRRSRPRTVTATVAVRAGGSSEVLFLSRARALASAGGINAYRQGWVRAPPRSLTDTCVVQSLTIAILAFHLALSARPVPALSRRDLRLISSARLAAGLLRLLPRGRKFGTPEIHSCWMLFNSRFRHTDLRECVRRCCSGMWTVPTRSASSDSGAFPSALSHSAPSVPLPHSSRLETLHRLQDKSLELQCKTMH